MNHLNPENESFFGIGSFKNHKYNGKELQETGMYDYGWRMYMPDIARWNGIDQLAEKFISSSPYAYVMNNPVSFFDPDGRDMEMPNWLKGLWYASPNGYDTSWSNTGGGFTSNWGGNVDFNGGFTNFSMFLPKANTGAGYNNGGGQ